MKCNQTDNVNVIKGAQKNKKFVHWQNFGKLYNQTQKKWALANYFENLQTTHSLSIKA